METGAKFINLPGCVDWTKVRLAMFDLDDTLFEYRLATMNGIIEMKSEIEEANSIDPIVFDLLLGYQLSEFLPRILTGEIPGEKERNMRIRMVLSKLGITKSDADIKRYENAFERGFWKHRKMIEGASELINYLEENGIEIALISNGNPDIQKRTLEDQGLGHLMDSLLLPESPEELKPSPLMFRKALARYGIHKDETVMIGDNWMHDVLGSLNAGIIPVWINRNGIKFRNYMGVQEFENIKGLLNFIRGEMNEA